MNWESFDLDNLRADAIHTQVEDFDYGTGYPEQWEYIDGVRCWECENEYVAWGWGHCPECETEGESEGPMMNNWYPLPMAPNVGAAALELIGVPLCLVYDHQKDRWGLALTGGGMNLSWEIAEAYIRLGYLPPQWINLPKMAGMEPTPRNVGIVNAVRRSQEIVEQRAGRAVEDADDIMDWLESNRRKDA